MADNPQDKTRPPLKTKLLRSQKIIQVSPTDARPQDIPEESEESEPPPPPPPPRENAPPPRSHTPGHLSTKSQDRRKQKSDLSLRQRSQSLSQKESSTPSIKSTATKPPSIHHGSDTSSPPQNPIPLLDNSNPVPQLPKEDAQRPINLRSTSSIAPKAPSPSHSSSPIPPVQHPPRGLSITHPSLPDPKLAANVLPAPASGMYWSRAPVSGSSHTSLRAHTSTLIGSNIYIFGGCDSRSCFNELYVLDADAFYWSTPFVCGDIPAPLRAMTCTAVGKKLIVFGGGDGPAYYNDIYVLDTLNFRWSKPRISGDRVPSKRRAHTACLYKNGIYIFGGGDGVRALNDVWRLDVADTNKMSWKLVSAPTPTSVDDKTKPKARGYHTANIVGSKLIIFGGSDGGECFRDVWVFDIETSTFSPVDISLSYPRLSHTATIVGSYLFVIGGHDGVEYSNEVLLLNLVTMAWDKRIVYGEPIKARGYHGTVLHDSRLVVIGGFDGGEVFGDVWVLELAVHAYYSQISHFSIDV